MKTLWLSRHPMSAEQLADLERRLGAKLDVIQLNVTFSACEQEAVDLVGDLLQEHQASVVAGVFPAHVAMELGFGFWDRFCGDAGPKFDEKMVAIPVAVPQFAEDGSPRGFAHARWVILGRAV